jgi:hypothetical protein
MVAQNRICHPTSATTEAPVPAQTLAELLRDLGLVLRRRFRHGAGLERAALLLQSLRWENKLALAFVNLRSSVQLRAMVEDWPLQCIQEAIQAQRLETLPLQAGHTRRVGRQAADLENKRAGFTQPSFLIWLAACVFAAGLAAGIIGGLR